MGTVNKICIFCGEKPENKNKEHVLSNWLINLTGDPKRVVNFGYNYLTEEIIKFDWSSFTFPSCLKCNEKYSTLEAQTKHIITKLLDRSLLSVKDYIQLLDWLDKVRIGLWLGFSYLYQNPMGILHKFHINSRIATKDRMIAIYPIDSNVDGLNFHGPETFLFQLQPSCFSLRINNTYILNMSWDFMCSANCGFPFPRKVVYDLDKDGDLLGTDIIVSQDTTFPILNFKLLKPTVLLYQPIISAPLSIDDFIEYDILRSKIIPGSSNMGILFRQFDNKIEELYDFEMVVEYDEVLGDDCRTLRDIVIQNYELLLESYQLNDYRSLDQNRISDFIKMKKQCKTEISQIIDFWKRNQST